MSIFTKPFRCEIPRNLNNEEGYARGVEFINTIISGGWPEELSGSWINFIDDGTNYTIAVYFNDHFPEAHIEETDSPYFINYPENYPDAYMSWNKNTGQIFEAYVKPTLRRTGIATVIALLICIHRAQNNDEYYTIKPDASNSSVMQLIDAIQTRYGIGPTRDPQQLFNSGIVYTQFESIELEEADQLFGGTNE
jgi:hypothetical protein